MIAPSSETDATLVVADEWVVDDVALDRLARALAGAPAGVAGVAATTGALAPGASYRVHAEWTAMSPGGTEPVGASRVRGAVLARPGVDVRVDGDVIAVDGSVVLDRGAHAHDPWEPVGPLEPASPRSRPPFPRRPVVAFLACEPDPDLVDWARRTANHVLRAGAEARLAVPEATEGLHLARPCAASEASIRALAPDVVVALDATALDQVDAWLGDDRLAVVVGYDPAGAPEPVLVSWRVGRASGRVRAHIARGTDPRALVALVHRLAAGPHPRPPVEPPRAPVPDGESRAVAAPVRTRARDRGPSVVAITASHDEARRARVEALLDHASAIGHAGRIGPFDRSVARDAASADLVLLCGAPPDDDLVELVAARRGSGRPTVLDLGPADVDTSDEPAAPERVLDAVAALAAACGLVIAPSAALLAAVSAPGVRTQLVPALLTRPRAAALRAARRAHLGTAAPVLGWHLGPGSPPDHLDALGTALHELLADVFDLSVEIAGARDDVPPSLLDHARVIVATSPPAAATAGAWTAAVWTHASRRALADPTVAVEAATLGVPIVSAGASDASYAPLLLPTSTVAEPGDAAQWHRRLAAIVGDGWERAARAEETVRRADALFGPATSAAVLNRLVGWARTAGAT
jgi:hypothetical protein